MKLLSVMLWLVLCAPASPALEAARIFGDSMVLPRGRPVAVWGNGAAGEVRVSFGGRERSEPAARDGSWCVTLPAFEAEARGRRLRIEADGGVVEFDDVLVGEVWLCSGQSNMDFPLGRAVGGREEAAGAGAWSAIRLLNLEGVHTGARRYGGAERRRLDPELFFEGSWRVASEESAPAFSAVGWWAGKVIRLKKDVPVGLIDNSVGGSGAEAWLPREVLEAREEYAELLGGAWMESERMSAWARGRARRNLGGKGADHPFRPGFLFDAGVRPWRGFPLSGVLWYQGETNAEIRDDAWNERLITDLVIGWRKVLRQPELPFCMVQLPRIGGSDPLRQWWPEFRDVQARAAGKLEGVRLVVTKDLGWESPDVHPPDKKPVGERLGAAAAREGF